MTSSTCTEGRCDRARLPPGRPVHCVCFSCYQVCSPERHEIEDFFEQSKKLTGYELCGCCPFFAHKSTHELNKQSRISIGAMVPPSSNSRAETSFLSSSGLALHSSSIVLPRKMLNDHEVVNTPTSKTEFELRLADQVSGPESTLDAVFFVCFANTFEDQVVDVLMSMIETCDQTA
ncbi:hypothetical protein LshimejAT787_1601000 [Lyophyllum shimeji]|uniref:Uncharacterized protein n=1 Tax=Lyophyllum shimeji TaxID=47721 RepID=A0A9P3UTZ4_LYOSH|nr:hypothetical protein LshimejAT787_1601000 [Lyophyllum shimeji]